MSPLRHLPILLAGLLLATACAGTDSRELSPYDDDGDGTSVGDQQEQTTDGETGDGDGQDPGGDGEENPGDGEEGPGDREEGPGDGETQPRCTISPDGTITASEIPIGPGLSAPFRVALDAPVNTVGTLIDGVRTWDLAVDLPGDEDLLIETIDPSGEWFADDFPEATYATTLSASTDLLGVFQITDDALLLLGIVSPEDSGTFSRTRLTYDTPIKILSLPLQREATWSTESIVSGSAAGISTAYRETYTTEVDRQGQLQTPYGTFPVLRVRTLMDRSSLGVPLASSRTFAFVSPCFGTVATIVSKDGESQIEFETASEVRRLTP